MEVQTALPYYSIKKIPRDIYINLFKIIYKKKLYFTKKKIYSMLNFFNTKSYIININQGSR